MSRKKHNHELSPSNEPRHDKTNKVNVHQAKAFAQSDQSLRCPHEETLGP